ncbi:hypothetical protein KC669_03515 [Candidatus Dojkabacteria bacterium]|uniref:Uncharacterized protein n=1 Tax=Candidatus Dojkabacteria bacterium TaxID=2099670 RepID=A0A955LBC9_9BACT|nr:hypothetical protein [Candidatus Dojkabacteria bacterium]
MIDKHLVKITLRPFLYALFISIGFFGLILTLEFSDGRSFIPMSVILYVLVAFELYSTANHYHIFHKKNTDAVYEFEDHRIIQYAHHAILPTMLYIGLVLFLFYHNEPSLYFLILLTTFVLFFILFENIHSFYKHKFSLNKSTHYIYDIVTIVLTFLSSAGLLELNSNTSAKTSSLFIVFISILVILNLLTISRHLITKSTFIGAIVTSIMLGVIFYLNTFGFVSTLLLAFIVAVIEYGFISVINELLDGKDVSKEEILEYLILVMLLTSLVLLNIS